MRAVLPAVVAVIAMARPVAADPAPSLSGARVLTAPTAWLPEAGAVVTMLGLDHRGDGAAVLGYGLGGIAEAELGAETDIRACTDCSMRQAPLWLGRAGFRIGARQGAWFTGMPAIVFGVRATFAQRGHDVHDARATDAYLVASRDLGVVRLHAGADAISASASGRRAGAQVRPLAGIELHPPMYPRSSLLGDVVWEPTLDAQNGPQLGWMFGVGVRYQAFAWASVELAVRAREGEGLGGSTVLVRVNARLSP